MRYALLAGFLVVAGVAQAGDSYTLEYKLAKGSRLKVEEQRTSATQNTYQDNQNKVGGAEEKTSHHLYTQEVHSDKPEILVRDYEKSTRSKHKPKAKPKPLKTSLHGQRVRLVGQDMQPLGQFEIQKPDREELKFDRLLPAFLPAKRLVEVKASWKVSGTKLAAAILPPAWKPTSDSGGKVTFKAVKTVKGLQVAILKVKARIIIERTTAIPGVEIGFKGELKWAIDDGVCVEASLTGPMKLVAQLKEDEKAEWTADGSYSWTYKAEILEARKKKDDAARKEGLPPPPGTAVIVCELQKEHRFELKHFARCVLCGEALDADKKCPAGDPWAYQYCPFDGSRLSPER